MLDNVFIWIGVLGLGVILAGITAKYLGGETVWNFFKGIFDSIVQLFRSIIDMSPGWLKIIIFLSLFALLHQTVINLTFGFAYYCDEGNVYEIDAVDAMGLRFFRSVMNFERGVKVDAADYWFYDDNNSLGAVFPRAVEGHPWEIVTNSSIDDLIRQRWGSGADNDFGMVICLDTNQKTFYNFPGYGGNCYLSVGTPTGGFLSSAEFGDGPLIGSFGWPSTGLSCEYNTFVAPISGGIFDSDSWDWHLGYVEYERTDSGELFLYITKREYRDDAYSLKENCDQLPFVDSTGNDALYLCIRNQYQDDDVIGDEADCGYIALAEFWSEDRIYDYKNSKISSINGTATDVAIAEDISANILTDVYEHESGSLIEFSCINEDLKVEVLGLPVFEPWFVFVIVFIGVLLYISNWIRGY